jgi:O-antigen/teichoic acid export membrane protein
MATNKNVLSLAANLSVAVFGFLSFLLLTRSLTKNDFGEWVLFITAANFLEMLRFGVTRTALIRFLGGADSKLHDKLIGSNYFLSLVVTAVVAVIVLVVYQIFPQSINDSGYRLFFMWYPLLAFLNLPFNNALTVLQAKEKFGKMLVVRLIQTGTFVLFLFLNLLFIHASLTTVVMVYLAIQLFTTLVTMALRWDGIKYLRKASRETNKIILNFGKYTTGTLVGSNLLKSSDTFILGLSSFMGTTGVALYSVPLKLTEVIEIPLRSFMATAYPRMSKHSMEGNLEALKKTYYQYSGAITFLMIPTMLLAFIFAKELVIIVGGYKYIHTADIFRVFAFYGLLLPIDRFTGVALDSINRPKKNFFKVIWMTLANILGDVFVIFVVLKYLLGISLFVTWLGTDLDFSNLFPASAQFSFYITLQGVALVTIAMTLIGMFVGYHYLRNETGIHFRHIFIEGFRFYKDYLMRYLKKS